MIEIARFQMDAQAQTLVDELAKRGITATRSATPSVTHAARMAGVVRVPPEDFEAAMHFVVEADLLPYSPWSGKECPACNSRKTAATKTYFKHVPWPLFLLSFLALGLPLLLVRHPTQCLDCGHLWK